MAEKPLRLCNYDGLIAVVRDMVRDKTTTNTIGRATLKRKFELFYNRSAGTEIPGDRYVRNIRQTLDTFGYERTTSQRRFHDAYLQACLPAIYGPRDFSRNQSRILAEHGLAKMHYEVLVVSPRRWGKTFSIGMFCAAMLLNSPGCWISVFSTGQRASTALLDTVGKFINAAGAADRIVKKNQEELFVKCAPGDPPEEDYRFLRSYPSSVSGLKGVGAKVVILEEASRLDNQVFTEVVVPLLGVSGTALLGISTPLGEENLYSELVNSVDPTSGDRLFRTLEVVLICPACQKAGVKDVCPHSAEEVRYVYARTKS